MSGTVITQCANKGKQIWHDLYHGVELDDVVCDSNTQIATVNLFIESGGYGAISVTLEEALDESINEFLETMSQLTSTPLSEYSNVWKFLPQEVQELKATSKGTELHRLGVRTFIIVEYTL